MVGVCLRGCGIGCGRPAVDSFDEAAILTWVLGFANVAFHVVPSADSHVLS
jgi:hypothetical protein